MSTDLIDFEIDRLEDLPAFAVMPAGVFKVEGLAITQKDVEAIGKVVELTFKVLETVELKNPRDIAPEINSSHTFGYPLDIPGNERGTSFSQGALKVVLSALAKYYQVSTLSEVTTKFPGTMLQIVVTNRPDKNDKTRIYDSIKEIVIL